MQLYKLGDLKIYYFCDIHDMKILVINGHKLYSYSPGNLNKFLFDLIIEICSKTHEIKNTIIETGYDIKEEINKYKWADIIIFQSPVNWYNVPWSFKKYIDDVYKAGEFYASSDKYGKGGKFVNKKYMLSLTCSASENEYINTDGFFNIRNIDDIFISFHKIHEYCAMQKLKTFVVYNVFHNLNIEQVKQDLIKHIKTEIPNLT